MGPLAFHVPGVPVAQPRPRAQVRGRYVHVHSDSPESDTWKRTVALAALAARPAPDRYREPVGAHLVFVFGRPASRNTRACPDEPYPVPVAPDLDNLAKAVLDALGPASRGQPGILWDDDALVAELSLAKVYTAHSGGLPDPGVYVHVYPLERSWWARLRWRLGIAFKEFWPA